MLPPNRIKRAGDFRPWNGHSHQAGGMESKKNSQTATASGWAFVRTPFVRLINDPKSHCEPANCGRQKKSDGEPRQKHRDILD
jgi:hypothetical protein